MYVWACVRACVRVCVGAYVHMCAYVCVHVCVWGGYVCVFARVYVCACVFVGVPFYADCEMSVLCTPLPGRLKCIHVQLIFKYVNGLALN